VEAQYGRSFGGHRLVDHGRSRYDTYKNFFICNSSIVPDIEVEEERTPTVSGEKAMLWHQRLGHIGEKGLRLLHGKGMVEGMSNCSLDFDFCEHCLYGKRIG
jgi:hypothetical protein